MLEDSIANPEMLALKSWTLSDVDRDGVLDMTLLFDKGAKLTLLGVLDGVFDESAGADFIERLIFTDRAGAESLASPPPPSAFAPGGALDAFATPTPASGPLALDLTAGDLFF